MWVGHACVQGASKHMRQRVASTRASCAVRGGKISCRAEGLGRMDGGSDKASSSTETNGSGGRRLVRVGESFKRD